MLKKNLTPLFALALVALAVPAFAGDVMGDYDDTFVADSQSTLSTSSYSGDAEEYSWATYEASGETSENLVSIAPVRGADCMDTDDFSVAYFNKND